MQLTISIPTYKRNIRLRRCLESILNAKKNHDGTIGLAIVVRDNNQCDECKDIVEEFSKRFNSQGQWASVCYKRNAKNIGGDSNIAKCYIDAEIDKTEVDSYQMVIGDDDAVCVDFLNMLALAIIRKKGGRPSLVITGHNVSDNYDRLGLMQGSYSSYREMMMRARRVYAELPIHHTLISCNIIRKGFFDSSICVRHKKTRYAHMYGVVSGLVSKAAEVDGCGEVLIMPKGLDVVETDGLIIETVEDSDVYREIPFRWAEYFSWLRIVNGVKFEDYDLRYALRSAAWPGRVCDVGQ